MSCRAIKRRSDPVAAALTTPPSQTKLCGSQSCWGTPCFAKKIDMERGRDKNAGQESNQEPMECVALTEHHKLPALGGKRRPDEFANISKHFLGSGQISPLRVRIHNVFTTVITVTCVSLDFDNTIELRANPLQNPSLSPAQPLTKPKPWAGEAERSSTARTRCTCCRCSRIFPSHLPRPHASQPPSPSVQTSHPLPLCKPAHASGKRNDGLLLFRPLHCELNVDFSLIWGVW